MIDCLDDQDSTILLQWINQFQVFRFFKFFKFQEFSETEFLRRSESNE